MIKKIGRMRVFAGYVFVISFLIFSCPQKLYILLSIPLLLGIAIRTWSAGSLVKKTILITSGPYSIIRHPLYFGSFLIGSSITANGGLAWFLIFLIGFFFFYIPKMLMEEKALAEIYKEEFERYKMETPFFLPYKMNFKKGMFRWGTFVKNKEYRVWIGLLIFMVLYYFKIRWNLCV